MELEVGDIVLCTVDRIVGTVVFVKIDGNGEGNIVFSEIAPGRIRNIRDYVVPKKRIVCKVLRIKENHIDLSLRRVSQKESKEVKQRAKDEQSYVKIFKSILKEKAENILEKIQKQKNIYDFIQEIKENPRELEKFIEKENCSKILDILNAQKRKKAIIKKEINLSSISPEGINDLKKILIPVKKAKIKYLSGGRYSIEIESDDIKEADNNLRKILEEIEKSARNLKISFSIKEK
jgi:translation initiation factor 2 alpha subunit (eIF-2alpha)